MSFDLPAFVTALCGEHEIPATHVSAVIDRAKNVRLVRDKVGGFSPLKGEDKGLVFVASLDGLEKEIDAADRALCRRVVARAAEDHRRGLLGRQLDPSPSDSPRPTCSPERSPRSTSPG